MNVYYSLAQFYYLLFTGSTQLDLEQVTTLWKSLLIWVTSIFGNTSDGQLAELQAIITDSAQYVGLLCIILSIVTLCGIVLSLFAIIKRCLSLGAIK